MREHEAMTQTVEMAIKVARAGMAFTLADAQALASFDAAAARWRAAHSARDYQAASAELARIGETMPAMRPVGIVYQAAHLVAQTRSISR